MNTNPAPQRVADKVKALTDSTGITQAKLARILHTSQQTISRKLTGEIPFRLDELDAVADALNVEPETLIQRNNTKV